VGIKKLSFAHFLLLQKIVLHLIYQQDLSPTPIFYKTFLYFQCFVKVRYWKKQAIHNPMSLSSISIQRPVFTIVMNLVIIIFGYIGFTSLGVREYPSIESPVITVNTRYVGANAEIIESQITEPLEEAINGIAGVASMTSNSRDGSSSISVEFALEVDLETAANDVRDKVSGALDRLPPEADPPRIAKADVDGGTIIVLNAKSSKRSLLELNAIGETLIKERLQTIPGVSEVQIWGEKKYAMRLEIDLAKLAAYQITPLEVRTALTRENVELPSGRIEGSHTELSVKTMGRLTNVEEFNNLVIKQEGDRLVRFKDIGQVRLSPENERTMFRRDGIKMIGLAISAQPGSNHIDISDNFYKRLAQIKKDLPEDIDLVIGFDNTKYIRSSIAEVEESVFVAFGLVVTIIFLFLRDWRTTVIPVLAIPISLIGAFFIMYVAGFSINVLTLLGIVLAIGLVVDDAIVVLENIYTKIEDGMKPLEAAYKGSNEIFFAVISTTITLAAVFMPVIFLQGITGRLFKEFGIVVAGSVIISAFVALTLTVMLSAKILKHREKHNWFYNITEPFFVGLNNFYKSTLYAFMKVRWVAFPLLAFAIFVIYQIFSLLPSELAPLEDRAGLRLSMTAPEGTTFEAMDTFMVKAGEFTNKQVSAAERETVITITSPPFGGGAVNTGFVRLILKPADERKRSQQQIADTLAKVMKQMTEARIVVIQEPTIGGRRSGQPVQYVLQAATLDKLIKIIPPFMAEVNQHPDLSAADVNLKFTKPEIRIEIDREKASNLGVSVADVAQTLQLGFSGQRFGYFMMNGKQYSVIGELKREDRSKPLDLKSLYVKNRAGNLIQLDNLVKLTENSSPPALSRYNRFVSATISANPATGKTIGQGLAAMEEITKKIRTETGENFTTALAGQSKEFVESSSSLAFAFVLALTLIYLVLAAQFESFRDPFIIMLTVPLALAGALFSLWYTDQTMNIFSQIGMIMLIGLVTKNAILIVEFANQRKEQGLTKLEAVKEAAVSRFRPILMTTLSTVLGILPIALALGAGSESRVGMGISVVGGMLLATGLTLYMIPALYSYLSTEHKHTQTLQELTVEKEKVEEVLV
jgi:multidrug efflux pump